jgi:hypothetical protein
MRGFARENQKSLAALLVVLLLASAAAWFMAFALDPVTKDRRYEVNSAGQSNLKFWIITWEPYDGTLWIGRPAELAPEAFDRLTGCRDTSASPPQPATPPQWSIKSVSDDRVVAEGKAAPVSPTAGDCVSTRGGHLLSLGKIAIAPGKYRFDLQFGAQLPDSMNFPVEVNLDCCFFKTPAKTGLGTLPGVIIFVIFPILFLMFSLLVLILLIRAGMYIYASRTSVRDQATPPR